jgi:hypothetical protein
LFQKLRTVISRYRKNNSWPETQKALVAIYGTASKTSTVSRWIRAAKSIDDDDFLNALKEFPDMKGAFLWDNMFLVRTGTQDRLQLSSANMIKAVQLLQGLPRDTTSQTFKELVCRPLKVLELWKTLLLKKFGNSVALEHLVSSLSSYPGLEQVLVCLHHHVPLDGTGPDNQGIPMCFALVRELERCLAKGLPPPSTIPTEAESQMMDEKEKEEQARKTKAEQEFLTAVAEQASADIALVSAASHANTKANEADLFHLSSCFPNDGSQASRGPQPVEVATDPSTTARAKVDTTLQKVNCIDTPGALLTLVNSHMKSDSRLCVLVEAPTTETQSFGHLMDEAHNVWDTFKSAYHGLTGMESTKFRLVVLVGSRIDLLAKAADKGKLLWPEWNPMVVQVQTNDKQSDFVRPTYAVVFAPPGEHTPTEPTVIHLPKVSSVAVAKFCLHLRCTEANCMWRPADARPPTGSNMPVDQSMDIDGEDRVNLEGSRMAETNDMDESLGDDNPQANEDIPFDEDETTEQTKKRDCVVDLWPFARAPAYYKELLVSLGSADKATAAVVLSATAHPSHWLACLDMGLATFVLTRRWSQHSAAHGMQLAKQLLFSQEMSKVSANLPPLPVVCEKDCQCIEGQIKPDVVGRVVVAYDISQGVEWHDGLNRVVPSVLLIPNSHTMVHLECDQNALRITGHTDKGRSLETQRARRDGEIVCSASALFFDSFDDLVSLLRLPGNARFADRVCKIDGVHRAEQPVEIWAVLVGVAQYIQDFHDIGPHANAVLEFDPSRGFNSDSLNVVVSTRKGDGIVAGSPILLKYGQNFNFESACAKDGSDLFLGALNMVVESQRYKHTPQALRHVVCIRSRLHRHCDSGGNSRLVQLHFTCMSCSEIRSSR